MADHLRSHDVVLADGDLALRPMTEDDWDVLLAWNNDPEVLYYAEGGDVTRRTLAEVQAMYRGVSRNAYVFVAELEGVPVGECWLQRMNLERILSRFPPETDLRRIDLTLGERALWGRGLGTRTVALLTTFAFETCKVAAVFACDVADYNPASRRVFEKNGYLEYQAVAQPSGAKAKAVFDLVRFAVPSASL